MKNEKNQEDRKLIIRLELSKLSSSSFVINCFTVYSAAFMEEMVLMVSTSVKIKDKGVFCQWLIYREETY